MLSNLIVSRYILKDSLVHKLNPVFKIISLMMMLFGIFFIDSYIDIIMLTFYLLLVISYSDIDPMVYLRNIFSIRIILLLILIIDLIFFRGIDNIVFYLSILTLTTASTEIIYGISKFLMPISKFVSVNDIAMIIGVSLRYIQDLSFEASRIKNIQYLRGVNFNVKGIKDKLSTISGIFTPMFTLTSQKSLKLMEMMDIRLYNYSKSRTNYRLNKWSKKDSALLVLNILILSIVMFY